MRFPIRGSKEELEVRIAELRKRGFAPMNKPRFIGAGSKRKEQYVVIMRSIDEVEKGMLCKECSGPLEIVEDYKVCKICGTSH